MVAQLQNNMVTVSLN